MDPDKLQTNEGGREIPVEIVQEVESCRFGSEIDSTQIWSSDKINLLLVASGLKPASEIRLVIKDENGMTGIETKLGQDKIDEHISLLRRLGVFFNEPKVETSKSKWKEGAKKRETESKEFKILIGRTQEELDILDAERVNMVAILEDLTDAIEVFEKTMDNE